MFIIEEDSSIIKFQNQAAKRLTTEFSDNFSISMLDDINVFEKSQERFALVETADIFNHDTGFDFEDIIQKLQSICEYVSMDQIIENHLKNNFKSGSKKVYKLRVDEGQQVSAELRLSRSNSTSWQGGMNKSINNHTVNKFVTIKVKR